MNEPCEDLLRNDFISPRVKSFLDNHELICNSLVLAAIVDSPVVVPGMYASGTILKIVVKKTRNKKLVTINYFWTRRPRFKCYMIKNSLEGVLSKYNRRGELVGLYTYKNNMLNGPAYLYDNDGMLRKELQYVNDVQYGKQTYYNREGVIDNILYYYKGNVYHTYNNFWIQELKDLSK